MGTVEELITWWRWRTALTSTTSEPWRIPIIVDEEKSA